jgi:carboxymethylenebutenolidase
MLSEREDASHRNPHRRRTIPETVPARVFVVAPGMVVGKTRTVRITLPSGTPAEIVKGPVSPSMGLVIAPDIWSLRPLYDDMVVQLARDWNMAVCAVEPFPGRDLPPEIGPRMSAVASLDDSLHLRDLHEAADALGTSRVGLMGFCMGGMYCFKSAISPRFARIASFYGMIRVPTNWQSATQGEPLDLLARGEASKVLAIIGSKDPYTPPDDVTALRATGCGVVEYADAEHAFAHDPSRPVHRKEDAADAFARARAWLESK